MLHWHSLSWDFVEEFVSEWREEDKTERVREVSYEENMGEQ